MENGSKDLTIHISAWSVLRILFLVTLFVLIFILRHTIMVFLAAVVLASSIEPLVTWLVTKKIPRLLGVVVIYAVLVAFFLGVFYFILPPLLSDMLDLVNTLPQYFDSNTLGSSATFLQFKTDANAITGAIPITDTIKNLSSAFSASTATVFQTALTIFGGAMSFVVILVLAFYLSAQADGVENFLKLVTPKEKEAYIIDLWKRTQRKIGFWLQGQFVLAIFVGLLVYVALSLVGIRHALLLAFFSGIFEIIPVFGPILGSIPGIGIALLDGGLTLGLLVAGLYVAIQQFESNIMYPLVVKKIIGISPLLVILSLIVGFQLGGFLGAILAVPIATAFVEYIDDIQFKRKNNLDAGKVTMG